MLEHKGTVTIETDRLILRRFEMSDAQPLFESCCGLEQVTRFLRYPTHKSVQDTKDIIAVWLEDYKRPDNYHWCIALKENNRAIGAVGVRLHDHDACGDIGYQLAVDQWGKGYMTEAVSAVIKFMFQQVGLNRMEAYHSVNNPASGAVMRRCGMQYEGMAREKYYCSAGYQDVNMYGILKSDLAR